jgi:Interferon-induced transmembrane protein
MTNQEWTGYEPVSQNQPVGPDGQYLSYDYQSPYSMYQGPTAPQYGVWQPQPQDYRAWVIAGVAGGVLFSLLIGMPLGLIAQRHSRLVRSKSAAGDYAGAAKAARSARSWAIASLVFDVLGLLLAIVLFSHSGQPTS